MYDFTTPLPAPSDNGDSGKTRDANGRFLPGNREGRGNPHAKKVHQLRAAMFAAVSVADMKAVVRAVVDQAKAGDLDAAELLLDRLLGKPAAGDVETQLAELERVVARLSQEEVLL